jgi:hypothetical protein
LGGEWLMLRLDELLFLAQKLGTRPVEMKSHNLCPLVAAVW